MSPVAKTPWKASVLAVENIFHLRVKQSSLIFKADYNKNRVFFKCSQKDYGAIVNKTLAANKSVDFDTDYIIIADVGVLEVCFNARIIYFRLSRVARLPDRTTVN